jgi:hypothetical protein
MTLLAPLSAAAAPPALFDHKQLKPGMVLQGESVFTLNGLEPFEAEVLAVMPEFLGPGDDLILARLRGATMDRYGVVSGMSGSPVYYEGKLVGAVSYRFGAFPREPIAGITPISSMLPVLKERRVNKPAWVAHAPASGPYGDAQPIETPLYCGGCSAGAMERMGTQLKPLGLVPVRGTGAPPAPEKFPMMPGGPVAGVLVDGDVNVMAIGTITYMDGDEVLAFGHPFTNLGDVEIPMASAQVFATIPSLSGSSKLGRSGAVVGALHDDRLPAIAGRLGWVARTVPFRVSVQRDGELDARKDVRFSVVDDMGSGAALTEGAVNSAILNRTGAEAVGTVHVSGRVTLADGRWVPVEDMFTALPARNPTDQASALVADLMQVLWRNAFERPQFKEVALTVRQETEPRLGGVTQVDVEPLRVRAGGAVSVRTQVRTHRGGLKEVATRLDIPGALAPGKYDVRVVDADTAQEVERDAGLTPFPQNLEDLLTLLRKRPRADRLYVYVLEKTPGARVDGVPVPGLPPSMMALLQEGKDGLPSKKLARRVVLRVEVPVDFVVFGDGDATLEVAAPRQGS